MAKYKLLNINTNKVDEFDTAEEALSATRAGFFGEKTHIFLPNSMYDILDESAVKNSDYANSINSMRGDMLNSMDNGSFQLASNEDVSRQNEDAKKKEAQEYIPGGEGMETLVALAYGGMEAFDLGGWVDQSLIKVGGKKMKNALNYLREEHPVAVYGMEFGAVPLATAIAAAAATGGLGSAAIPAALAATSARVAAKIAAKKGGKYAIKAAQALGNPFTAQHRLAEALGTKGASKALKLFHKSDEMVEMASNTAVAAKRLEKIAPHLTGQFTKGAAYAMGEARKQAILGDPEESSALLYAQAGGLGGMLDATISGLVLGAKGRKAKNLLKFQQAFDKHVYDAGEKVMKIVSPINSPTEKAVAKAMAAGTRGGKINNKILKTIMGKDKALLGDLDFALNDYALGRAAGIGGPILSLTTTDAATAFKRGSQVAKYSAADAQAALTRATDLATQNGMAIPSLRDVARRFEIEAKATLLKETRKDKTGLPNFNTDMLEGATYKKGGIFIEDAATRSKLKEIDKIVAQIMGESELPAFNNINRLKQRFARQARFISRDSPTEKVGGDVKEAYNDYYKKVQRMIKEKLTRSLDETMTSLGESGLIDPDEGIKILRSYNEGNRVFEALVPWLQTAKIAKNAIAKKGEMKLIEGLLATKWGPLSRRVVLSGGAGMFSDTPVSTGAWAFTLATGVSAVATSAPGRKIGGIKDNIMRQAFHYTKRALGAVDSSILDARKGAYSTVKRLREAAQKGAMKEVTSAVIARKFGSMQDVSYDEHYREISNAANSSYDTDESITAALDPLDDVDSSIPLLIKPEVMGDLQYLNNLLTKNIDYLGNPKPTTKEKQQLSSAMSILNNVDVVYDRLVSGTLDEFSARVFRERRPVLYERLVSEIMSELPKENEDGKSMLETLSFSRRRSIENLTGLVLSAAPAGILTGAIQSLVFAPPEESKINLRAAGTQTFLPTEMDSVG